MKNPLSNDLPIAIKYVQTLHSTGTERFPKENQPPNQKLQAPTNSNDPTNLPKKTLNPKQTDSLHPMSQNQCDPPAAIQNIAAPEKVSFRRITSHFYE